MEDKLDNEKENVTEKSLQARVGKLTSAMRVSENLPVATIASWKAQIDILSALASSAGIFLDISSLRAQLASVESEVGVEKAKAVMELYDRYDKELLAVDPAGMEKIEEFHQQGLRLARNHQEFMVNADKYLEKKKRETKALSDVADFINEKNLKGEEIDPNILKPLIKTPEQIQKEIEERRKLEQHKKEVEENYEAVHAHDKELKAEEARLQQDLANKEKPQDSKLVKLDDEKRNKLQLCAKKIKALLPIIQKVDKQKEQVDAVVRKLDEDKEERNRNSELVRKKIAESKAEQAVKDELLSNLKKILSDEEVIANSGIDVRHREANLTKSSSANPTDQDQKTSLASLKDSSAKLADKIRGNVGMVYVNESVKTNIIADPTPAKKNIGSSKTIG
jgi:type II secretory pathway component PulM